MSAHPIDNRPAGRPSLARVRVTRGHDSPTVDCVPATWPVEEFATYIRALMEKAGIPDFADLSRLSGVSQSQFSYWTRGKTQPSRRNLKRIASPLGLRSPVTLYIAAGLDAEEDLELDAQVDFTVLPKPFQDLRHVYERAKAMGREDLVISSISVLVSGLNAELNAEIDRGKAQPSGRRKQAS